MIAHPKPTLSRATITIRDDAGGVSVILDLYPKLTEGAVMPMSATIALAMIQMLKDQSAAAAPATTADKDQTVFGMVEGVIDVPAKAVEGKEGAS